MLFSKISVKRKPSIFRQIFDGNFYLYKKNIKLAEGYNDDELRAAESRLDISISGELRAYLEALGKCSGVFFKGDDFYNLDSLCYWHERVRDRFFAHSPELRSEGIFIFSDCLQAVSFSFLKTKSEFPDLVYGLAPDDDEDEIRFLECNFLEYQSRRFRGSVESLKRFRSR